MSDLAKETIEELAAFERAPTSEGERRAAELIAARLESLGCEARIEEELAFEDYAKPMAAMSAIGVLAGLLAMSRRRVLRAIGAVLGLGAAAGIAEDASNVARLFRRATMRERPTWNVVAEAGDRNADRTMVVLAHHDASRTGFIFDQRLQRRVYERFPELIERTDTSLPLWWSVVAGPALAALGAITGRRGVAITGSAMSAFAGTSFVDIARSEVVPGANDNLSGVAALACIAESLRDEPLSGLRVLLVSCGSEEVLQGGIHGFAKRHFPDLPPERTWIVNHDSIGSPHLALLEGEGTIVMEDFEPLFKGRVARIAEEAGIPLRRGLRSRFSTDSVIPHRHGYPVAGFASITDWKAVANYHWPTDVPENVDHSTLADAVRLTRAIAESLATGVDQTPAEPVRYQRPSA